MEPIKVKDKWALEMASKLTGYRALLDDLAIKYGVASTELWDRLHKIYKLDKDKLYLYDHVNKEIKER